jgi:hypothetical protein
VSVILPDTLLSNDRIHGLMDQLMAQLDELVKVERQIKPVGGQKHNDPGTIVVPCVATSNVGGDIRAVLNSHALG